VPTLSFDISQFKNNGKQGNWIKLSGNFIAKGNENVLVIGNFSNPKMELYFRKRILNYKTDKQFKKENFGGANYYLDSFSLVHDK
jgi:hypothetical protein